MLKLYATPVSIYSAKVRLALAMTGVAWTELEPPGGYRSEAYRAIVPQGTIPALDHDGFVLAESDAILEYLDEQRLGCKIMSDNVGARARARALSRYIDMRVEPAARALFPLLGRRRAEASAEALNGALRILARQVEPHPFLAGRAPSLPDFGCLPLLLVIDLLERWLPIVVTRPGWEADYRAAANEIKGAGEILARYSAALDEWAASKMEQSDEA